jgi:hypothetical protein
LEEDGVVGGLLPPPAERLVEGLGATEVRDTECDEAESLFHGQVP